MKNVLNEAYKVSRSDDLKGNPIAFIDPNAPENKDTYNYVNIFHKYDAKWSKSPQFRNVFPPHDKGFWFWYIGKTEDKWRNFFDWRIKPALEAIHQMEGAGDEESKESVIASLDALVQKISSTQPVFSTELVITDDMKNVITAKLEEFKMKLMNIKDDETFKETMKKVMSYRKAKGYSYSLFNNFLIMIQNPNATIVNSKTDWFKYYNRTVNQGANPIALQKPAEKLKVGFNNSEKTEITNNFLKKTGVNSTKDLGAGQRQKLDKELTSGKLIAKRFELYSVYDVKDTTLIEGKPDPIQDLISRDNVEWHPDNNINDDVKPIYDALLSYAQDKGIEVELADEKKMGTSKGVSTSGKIIILQNSGNDVGMTKTLAHELSHELLHQKYAKGKNKDLDQFFIGTEQGSGVVEQQAELTAWMVMASFGFDLQTTSINYVVLWGGDDKNMLEVFDAVSSVANYLIYEITNRGVKLTEVEVPTGVKKYTQWMLLKYWVCKRNFKML